MLLRVILKGKIKANASINHNNVYGVSALTMAISGNYATIVNTLIGGGADIDAPTKDGATPLIIAAQKGLFLIVESLDSVRVDVSAILSTVWEEVFSLFHKSWTTCTFWNFLY